MRIIKTTDLFKKSIREIICEELEITQFTTSDGIDPEDYINKAEPFKIKFSREYDPIVVYEYLIVFTYIANGYKLSTFPLNEKMLADEIVM